MKTISIPTCNLHHQQLDWAVALAYGHAPIIQPLYAGGRVCAHKVHIGERDTEFGGFIGYEPSSDGNRAQPIIEMVGINLRPCYTDGVRHRGFDAWLADVDFFNGEPASGKYSEYGRTALEAAMRCYVASKMGDTVDIPVELL